MSSRRSSSLFLLSHLSLLIPPSSLPLSRTYIFRLSHIETELEEVDGPLCPWISAFFFFFPAHRRRVNRTPRRILSTFRRHFVNVSRAIC